MPKKETPLLPPSEWPGERLGLPREGSHSIAGFGRRILALLIDWASALLITHLFWPTSTSSFVTLAVFAVLQIIFIPTIGGSPGHRICGCRVVALNGDWVGLWRPAARTLLLCIVIPAIVWDSDRRGFHDKIPGTLLVRV